MLQLVATNMCFQIKNSIRDAQITQPWEKINELYEIKMLKYTLRTLKKASA